MLWLIKQCYLASISMQHFICAVSARSKIYSLNTVNCCLFFSQIRVGYPAEATLQPDKEHLVAEGRRQPLSEKWTELLAGLLDLRDKTRNSLSFSLLFHPPVCGSSPLFPPSLHITLAHRLSLFLSFPPSISVQPLTLLPNKKKGKKKKRLECG